MSKLLEAQNLKKVFDRQSQHALEILSGVDFSLEKGERVAILGKSGEGKSTFLHLLGTLEEPTEGKVFFRGRDLFALKEKELSIFRNQKVGFVFQFHYLMLEFTALENTMMPGLIGGLGKDESRQRAKELLDQVGLSERLHHKPGQLSGGEQQRVAIARALLMRPEILLTDEMTGNLDPVTGQQVMELIHTLHSQYQMAMVSVTHDENLARQYPKVYRLTNGRLS
ncbi:MAG: ABC transporter ATP-binding protein [Proteobacteria bacterium]|nr:ABC transporter ATP-binding protein [Pseudomonadota bacterium]NDC24063.1 ABC transporter ATP-binding protein [Pseudomonadota bacterium]NDD04150.1 ABC transporter ATP-binding protein [Pseudomonadota bacterium]